MQQEYVPPAVEDLGQLHEVTFGQATGTRLDADFSRGTSLDDITFS